jgi:pimeloyl-ACP methyl ester carboxylesterase/DNA-binding CsgD family transcriptional regulator
MQPQLRFARTSDGVNIAYFSAGRGPAIVFGSNIWGDANFYALPHPHTRRMTDALVDLGWRVIRYDHRGLGSSQRDVEDLSLQAKALDIAAIVDDLGLRQFALAGVDTGAATAMAYAAAHPDRVTRIAALNGWASLKGKRRQRTAATIRSVLEVAEDDWEFFTLTLAKLVTELDDPAHTQELAQAFRRSSNPRTHNALMRARENTDLQPLLPSITMPVLVVHDTGFPFGDLALCQELVSSLPDARLVIVRGDGAAEIEAIDAFMREGSEDVPEAAKAPADGLTPREVEVLRLIAAGRTNREISEDLVLSVRTVARHITNVYAKIGARSKAEATAYAIRHNLT